MRCEDKPDYCGGECHADCAAEKEKAAVMDDLVRIWEIIDSYELVAKIEAGKVLGTIRGTGDQSGLRLAGYEITQMGMDKQLIETRWA
jgi:hypothetical protein